MHSFDDYLSLYDFRILPYFFQSSAIFTAVVFSAYSSFIMKLIQAGTNPCRLSPPVGEKPLESSLACFIYLYHVCQSECQGGRSPGGLFPP